MKLLEHAVVINDDAEETGGAAAIALASVRLLRQRGVRVTVLSGSGGGTALRSMGADTIALGGMHIMQGGRTAAAFRGLYDRGIAVTVARWIAANDTPGTIYHLHNWHKVLSPSVFRALRPIANRLFVTAHDYFLICPNGGYFRYPRRSICELVPGSARCLAADCDRRHYVHKLWRALRHEMRRALFDLSGSQADVLLVHDGMLPHFRRAGIPHQRMQVLRNPVSGWRSTRIKAEENRDVFYVGRVEADKGVDLLARAAARAGVRLRVIGSGPLEQQVRRENGTADLLGWRSREQIAALVRDARMLVVPTRWRETFGLVAVEALLSGIPVITSRFSLISDEIVRLGFGLSCDPYDELALAEAISLLRHDDALVREMSRRAYSGARVLAPTAEEWCDALLRIYENKLQSPPQPETAMTSACENSGQFPKPRSPVAAIDHASGHAALETRDARF
ncbi:MAG: glycosyltransferase family 4 protein [Alphaproteobacteria bacterium]|nr:glycosyltransferase family 4 protein [Alphaproteobacteria bacterium]MBV9151138.1 glycosyltransferase family 4 protein [Alphaproteobacteria bacterium]